jgi:hypothetical protein
LLENVIEPATIPVAPVIAIVKGKAPPIMAVKLGTTFNRNCSA